MTIQNPFALMPALLSALLLAGCGGGETTEPAPSVETVARPASVRLEGCVVDAGWQGASGAAVHVRTADGRAVATVFSDARGVFVASVPARAAIVLSTSDAGTAGLELNAGSGSISVGACLVADT